MKIDQTLMAAVLNGQASTKDNPSLYSSPMWEAFELGRRLHSAAAPLGEGDRAAPGRGDTWNIVRANGVREVWAFTYRRMGFDLARR
jgi:hypothetical protein